MTDPATAATCPVCRTPLPADAPEGACPACLLRAGFPTGGAVGAATAAGSDDAATLDEVARKLPQFEVVERIGRGGMGVVFRARQRTLDRDVALKVLPPRVASAPGFAERFRREARALARLDHPNVVRVHESGEADGLYWLAMEFVDGTNLRQAMEAGAIRPREALAIVRQICDALEYAHAQGIVHRDVKPENVLLDRAGNAKVADFGLAKIAGAAPDPALTLAGQVMGTPAYMAPEQIEHPSDVDHRADIYSLGVVFYELLTGELPLGRFAPPSHKVELDVRLDEVVLRTLAKEREARYQRAAQVRTQMDVIAAAGPPAPPRRGPRAAAGAAWDGLMRFAQREGVFAVCATLGLWGLGRFAGGLATGTYLHRVRVEFLWEHLALSAGGILSAGLYVRARRADGSAADRWLAAATAWTCVAFVAYGLLTVNERKREARVHDVAFAQAREDVEARGREEERLDAVVRDVLRRLQIVHPAADWTTLRELYAPADRPFLDAVPAEDRARRGADGMLGLPLVSEERLGAPLARCEVTSWSMERSGRAEVELRLPTSGASSLPFRVELVREGDAFFFPAAPVRLPELPR